MRPRLDRLFAAFEGTRSAYPVAIFRIFFFTGLAIHFFPSLIWLDEGYRPGAVRSDEWNTWLYMHFSGCPHAVVRGLSIVTMAACVAAIVGVFPRIAVTVCGVGLYTFASFNALHLQTLALVEAWAVLLLWMVCGGGTSVLSLDALRRGPSGPAREPRLFSSLVLYQILLGVFFAGVEKVLAGWPGSNEMGVLLSYPRGAMVRDWVAMSDFMHRPGVGRVLSWATLAVELGSPIALLFKRTRIAALVVYEGFFLGIIAMLEVPPLFYFTFAFGGLLALDDQEVARARAWLDRRPPGLRSHSLQK
jgi:hypothetical protein